MNDSLLSYFYIVWVNKDKPEFRLGGRVPDVPTKNSTVSENLMLTNKLLVFFLQALSPK